MNPLLNAEHILAFVLFVMAIGGLFAAITRWLGKQITDANKPQATLVGDLVHKIANLTGRTDALEHSDTKKEIRLAKMEMSMTALKEGQDRIEKAQAVGTERLEKSQTQGFERIEKRLNDLQP